VLGNCFTKLKIGEESGLFFFSSLSNMIGFKLKTVGFFLHCSSLVDKMAPDVFLSTDGSLANLINLMQ